MRYAIIENSTVTNIAEASSPLDSNWVADDGTAQIGGTWDGQAFHAPPPPPIAALLSQMEAAIQSQLDTYAQSWGYTDIATACTYVGSTVAKFNNEGVALRNWRDATWIAAETLIAQIQGGTATMPSTVAAALALMPAMPARPAN